MANFSKRTICFEALTTASSSRSEIFLKKDDFLRFSRNFENLVLDVVKIESSAAKISLNVAKFPKIS
jgi:hypothetical protein